MASPTQDKVRELQRTLYRAAKADPQRRFHALWDKVHRRDVLGQAWEQVRRNRGAAGIDRQTIQDIEQYGVDRLLDELAADLKAQSYRTKPARRVFIAKPGRAERRPLSIPTVRDRIVQAAAKIVLEPIFEADFQECSFGFRPKRAPHDALQALLEESWNGRRWVVETDVASCFEAIPHDGLMQAVKERVVDRHVLKLLGAMLRSGVMEGETVKQSDAGTPQGGVISPLLANVYLHRLDREWQTPRWGRLVRYADDLVVMCLSRVQANAALDALRSQLAGLGLSLREEKTRIVHLREGGEGFDFLGFHHRYVRNRTPRSDIAFLARWPSKAAERAVRDRMRELTARNRLRLPVKDVVRDLNRLLRGWSGYFRYGNSARSFQRVDAHAIRRLGLLVAKRHQRRSGWGFYAVIHRSPNHMGLHRLQGSVQAPRPNRPWRGVAVMPPVKNVGEPLAGKPHGRFEVAAGGVRANG